MGAPSRVTEGVTEPTNLDHRRKEAGSVESFRGADGLPWFPRTAVLLVAILLAACQSDDHTTSIDSSDIEKSICTRFTSFLSGVSAPSSMLDQRALGVFADLLEMDLELADQVGDRPLAKRIEKLIEASRKDPADKVDVTVYLRDDLPEDEVEQLKASIQDATGIFAIEYVTSSEAFDEYKDIYEDQPEFFEDIPEDSLPASLRLSVDDRDEVETLKSHLLRNREVDDVRDAGNLERLDPVITREMERCLGLFD